MELKIIINLITHAGGWEDVYVCVITIDFWPTANIWLTSHSCSLHYTILLDGFSVQLGQCSRLSPTSSLTMVWKWDQILGDCTFNKYHRIFWMNIYKDR